MANEIARALRRRTTLAEGRLWDELRELRRRGYHFRRQAPIEGYVVDFICFSRRLVVEVDGIQHDAPEHRTQDSDRDAHLRFLGFDVLRFKNSDVMENIDGVMIEVLAALGAVVRHD
ncbi:MAG: endonuclease domain-containing protein [Hyphomicrobiaceae bacterium]